MPLRAATREVDAFVDRSIRRKMQHPGDRAMPERYKNPSSIRTLRVSGSPSNPEQTFSDSQKWLLLPRTWTNFLRRGHTLQHSPKRPASRRHGDTQVSRVSIICFGCVVRYPDLEPRGLYLLTNTRHGPN